VRVQCSHGHLGAPGFGVHRVTQFAQEPCDGLLGCRWWPANFPLPTGLGYVLPGLKPSEHLGHFIDVGVGPPDEAAKRAERPAGNHRRPHLFLQLPCGDVGHLFDTDLPGPANVDVLTVHARDVDRASQVSGKVGGPHEGERDTR